MSRCCARAAYHSYFTRSVCHYVICERNLFNYCRGCSQEGSETTGGFPFDHMLYFLLTNSCSAQELILLFETFGLPNFHDHYLLRFNRLSSSRSILTLPHISSPKPWSFTNREGSSGTSSVLVTSFFG